jgi:rSAM/selenodomain-associated transferase 2
LSASVTVLIPTLNEAASIASAVESAFAAGAAEVIVADGGSTDETVRIARECGARVVAGESMRSRQLNRGAEAAVSDALIFLHADTTLPIGACAAVVNTLTSGAVFGGFRLRFAEDALRLRLAAALINLRTRITRCPWGDQAQFVPRSAFLGSGGFLEIAIMEDYELAIRMKRRGRSALLPQTVVTSGRRFLERGILRTTFTNWRIIAAWRMGADAERLARIYRG